MRNFQKIADKIIKVIDEELDFLYVQSFDLDGNFYQTSITKKSFIDNIKSIVTKEQFEQMSYKVGE